MRLYAAGSGVLAVMPGPGGLVAACISYRLLADPPASARPKHDWLPRRGRWLNYALGVACAFRTAILAILSLLAVSAVPLLAISR